MVGGACTNAFMELLLLEVLARGRDLGEELLLDDGFNDCALGGGGGAMGQREIWRCPGVIIKAS